ncbi:MAG: copper chaperone PCu(A)C [Ilumatobacteraceae bacterium]|nr:copper chaperone PCu(A)C [Ilumatobacteraceae bacterium]
MKLIAAAATAILVLVGAACDEDTGRINTAEELAAPGAVGDDLPIEMIIYSSNGDEITGVEVSPNLAASAVMLDAADAEVDSIELPKDEFYPLALGTSAIVLQDLARDLEIGDRFEVTLLFDKADDRVVPITVVAAR